MKKLIKNSFTTCFLSFAVLVGSLSLSPIAQAEKEGGPAGTSITHDQNHTDSRNQVQAFGVAPDPSLSFVERYSPPKTISSFGNRLDWLFAYTSWVGFVFFVIMAGSLFYFVIANRAKPGHRAFYTHGTSKGNGRVTTALDVAVFITLDIVLIVASFRDTRDIIWNYPKGEDVARVMVMPQQWAWNFKYPGADGQFDTEDDIMTVNDLRVPKGKRVMMQIKSKDVIHGFFIPNIRIQIDAIPGMVTKFWFDTNESGDYEIACYHLCGTAHYKMKAFMKVMDEDRYNAWVSEASEWAKASYDHDSDATRWGWNWNQYAVIEGAR